MGSAGGVGSHCADHLSFCGHESCRHLFLPFSACRWRPLAPWGLGGAAAAFDDAALLTPTSAAAFQDVASTGPEARPAAFDNAAVGAAFALGGTTLGGATAAIAMPSSGGLLLGIDPQGEPPAAASPSDLVCGGAGVFGLCGIDDRDHDT